MSVSLKDQWVYVFGSFVLDPARRTLTRAGTPLSLSPKSFDLLFYLVENPDRVLSKDELLSAVWPGRVVEESNLSQTVFVLRKTLDAGAGNESVIATSAGRGYRVALPVRVVARTAQPTVSEPVASPSDMDAANAPELMDEAVVLQHPNVSSDSSDSTVTSIPRAHRRRNKLLLPLALVTVIMLVAGGRSQLPIVVEPHVVVLADFDNTTGDPVFDGVLGKVLEIDLNQSPFLTLFSQRKIQETLERMGRTKDEKVTPKIAQEVCERNHAQAVVNGAVAAVGARYVVTLSAIDCNSGNILAEGKADESSKEGVLQSLDALTAKIRKGVGESVASIQKFDVATTQATTSSFEALKAFSLGLQARAKGDNQTALAFHKHAVELDPSFAMAYVELGAIYTSLHEHDLARVNLKKAYELRNRVSEHEKMRIAAFYQVSLSDTKGIIQSYKMWTQTYPQDWPPWANLANCYTDIADYAQAIEAGKEALRLMPDHAGPYYVLARAYERANQFDQAKAIGARATAKGLDGADMHGLLYEIAFAEGDTATMAAQVAKEIGQPSESIMLDDEALAAATSGKKKEAITLFERAIALAQQDAPDSNAEVAGFFVDEIDSLTNLGAVDEAKKVAAAATALEGNEFAPMVLAKTGDIERAQSLADVLSKKTPADIVISEDDNSTTRAAIHLEKGMPKDAISDLDLAKPYELRNFEVPSLLAKAYLDAKMPELAAAEYRKILLNHGVDGLSIQYPLAHLGLARAEAQMNDKRESLSEYRQFLAAWKDGDPDVPALQQATREYAELNSSP
jgi:DNA-binding winged helix-turn-helix (wHTH) protein/tetratricopeptide (TPR) repeat protein